MKTELAISAAVIGLASVFGGSKPVESSGYRVHNQYPVCGSEAGLPKNHTAWIVDVTEDKARRAVPYDLGPLPGQCRNPDESNDIKVSVTLSRSQAVGGTVYGPHNIAITCFDGAQGFSLRRGEGSQANGFNAVSGGLDPKRPTTTLNLRINQDQPDGTYTGVDILQCYTAYGTSVPIRIIHRTIELVK